MKICFYGNFNGGGTETSTYLLANELASKHDVFVVNTTRTKPNFYLMDKVNYEILYQKSLFTQLITLRKFLMDNQIDLLISVEALTGIISIGAAKLARCKHIIWEHANYYQTQNSRWMQKVRQIALLVVDAYVVLTKRDLNNFKQHFTIKTELTSIYNIAKPQNESEYSMESKTIVSAGHIRWIKNFIVIPEIAKIVLKKHPDWRWEIYGNPVGEEFEKIKLKLKEYQLQDKVIFCGRSDHLEAVYQNSAIYVMTSLSEGLPMVLLEAKSNKLPLISFDIETGPDEIIQNGVNGYLIPPYDTNKMAEKICYLIEHPEIRKNFSDASDLDLELFSKEVIVEKWYHLLKHMKRKNA